MREELAGTQEMVKGALPWLGVGTGRWTLHLVLGSHQAVIAAVEAKAGIALVSDLAIKKNLALGLVKQMSVEGLSLKRHFHCVYRKEHLVSRVLQMFVGFIEANPPLRSCIWRSHPVESLGRSGCAASAARRRKVGSHMAQWAGLLSASYLIAVPGAYAQARAEGNRGVRAEDS